MRTAGTYVLGLLFSLTPLLALAQNHIQRGTWIADNGNGTLTNPLFYEEFSDPDLIRVEDDYYMTDTTMHTMPGLSVLHSRDLGHWELPSYVVDRLDVLPQLRMEDGQEFYG